MKDWIELKGGYLTPGGDPLWMCPDCGKESKESWHVYGVECPENRMDICPHCGISLKYPWEKNNMAIRKIKRFYSAFHGCDIKARYKDNLTDLKYLCTFQDSFDDIKCEIILEAEEILPNDTVIYMGYEDAYCNKVVKFWLLKELLKQEKQENSLLKLKYSGECLGKKR